MQCPTCGSRVPDGADVCPDCGMDLQSLSPPTPSPTPDVASSAEFTPADSVDESAFEIEFDDFTAASPDAPDQDSAPVSLDKTDSTSSTPAPAAPGNPAPRASLTLKRGGTLTDEKFVIGAMASIGRFDPESGPVDVDMASLPEASYVSRHHAEIRGDENGWRIKDLGSRNGTFVRAANGGAFARVQGEHKLHDGDEVSLGNARFEFHTEN